MRTVRGWIEALPAPVLDAHPWLVYELGMCALQMGDFKVAQVQLEQALQTCQATGNLIVQYMSMGGLASCAFLQGDFERSGEMIRRLSDAPIPPHNRVQLLMERAALAMFRRDWTQAAADFHAALDMALGSGDPALLFVLAFYLKSEFAVLPGGLEGIERLCRQAQRVDEISSLQLAVEELMAFIHLWRGRWAQAIQAGEHALAIKERLGSHPFLGADAAGHLAIIHAARGDYSTAVRFHDMRLRQAQEVALNQLMMAAVLYPLGRTRWLEGRLAEARQVYARMCALENPSEVPFAPALRTLMRGLLELADGRYAAAETCFRQAAALEQQAPISIPIGSARLMLCRLYLEWNRPQDALAELAPVLAACQREGTAGFILKEGAIVVPVLHLAVERGVHPQFAAHLLDILGASAELRPVRVPDTGETLTPREVEVLRLIASGASNQAIAQKLVVSEHTVKVHITHILGKLRVSSRTQAAARARELRLV